VAQKKRKREKKPQARPEKNLRFLGWLVAGGVALAGAGFLFWPGDDPATAKPGEVIVYKSPTCGCCKNWVAHMQDAGFKVTVNDTSNMDAVKERYKVPYEFESCHTAVVDGYVVEGHVPANDVRRLLAEKPDVAGLAVPDMPAGAPGMEQGGERDPYKVLIFGRGAPKIYSQY